MSKPKPKRTRMVRIRFTEDEYAAVSQKAIASQLTLSELVRRAALEKPLPQPKSEMAIATYEQLARLGNNVNQLAKAANTAVKMGEEPKVSVEHWQKVYQEIKHLGMEIIGDR